MHAEDAIPFVVIPANAGIHFDFAGDSLHTEKSRWTPAFSGVTEPG